MHAVTTIASPYLPEAPTGKAGPPLTVAYPHGIRSLSKGTTIYDALARLGEPFAQVPLPAEGSMYVRPASINYTFDGKQKRWDVVESMPSVGIVLHHTGLKAMLLVRQFRPPVYANQLREAEAAGRPRPGKETGFTYELCAGLLDKDKSLAQTAREEVLEETGYDVPLAALQPLGSAVASAGTSGAQHTMFLATVDESMRVPGQGGGLVDHSECIEVLALPFEHLLEFVLDDSLLKSPGAMFGAVWLRHAAKPNSSSDDAGGMYTQELTLKSVLSS